MSQLVQPNQAQDQSLQSQTQSQVTQKKTNSKKTSKHKAKQRPIQAKQKPVKAKQRPVQAKQKPIQPKAASASSSNAGSSMQGLPEPMKNNMEAMGGVDLSDVKVHHNSGEPQKVGALAYAQGSDIHLGPGQEKHLGHEAWHTVQQKQGRVKPTRMYKRDTPVNDDAHLEREADEMATKARQCKCATCAGCGKKAKTKQENQSSGTVVQRKEWWETLGDAGQSVKDFYDDAYEMRDKAVDWVWDNTSGRVIDYVQDTDAYRAVEEKVEEVIDSGAQFVFDYVLPVGQGYHYELSAGVTWGVPIHTGGGGTVYIKRKDANTVHLLVRKYKKLAGDVGVGGAIGLGDSGKKNGKREMMVGGSAGLNAEAGIQVTSVEEFEIPVSEFLMFVGKEALEQVKSLGGSPFQAPVDSLLSGSSSQYLVSDSIDLTLYAQATGEAGIGLMRESDSYNPKDLGGGHKGDMSTWGPTDERHFQGSTPGLFDNDPIGKLASSLGLFISNQVRGQVNAGRTIKKQGNKTITTLSLDGELSAMLNLPIPVVTRFLQMFPNGVGVGMELIFTQEPGAETKIMVQLYQKSGEDKVYAGNYNKQAFQFDVTGLISFDEFVNALEKGTAPLSMPDVKNAFTGVAMENRMLLSGPAMGKLGSFLRRQQGTRSLLADKTKSLASNAGFSFDVYLDLNSHINDVDFMAILNQLKSTYQETKGATKEADGLWETFSALKGYLFGGNHPELDKLVDEVLNRVVLDKALARLQVSAGTGVSGKLGAGAKVRGDLSVQAGMFCELDVMKHLGQGGQITLRSLIEGFPDMMNHPKKYFSDCPIIDFILSLGAKSSGGSGGGKGKHGSGKVAGKGTGTAKTKKSKKAGKESKSDDGRIRSLNVENKSRKYSNVVNYDFRILRAKKNEDGTYEMDLVIQNLSAVEIKLPRLKFSLVEDNSDELILKLLTPWTISHETLGSDNTEDYLSSEKGEIYIFDKL
ncbi:hypothetical protein BKI52_01785 [marine bacterium AO1-C]|nr:hypothetical protein BKI52_01785 [marine bacterium AO1-C]